MSKIFTFLMLTLLPGMVYANLGSEELTTSIGNVSGGFPHLTAENRTASILRLQAKTYTKYYSGSFVPVDSSYYVFSSGRGGHTAIEDPNNDESVYFDKSITYIYDKAYAAYTNRLMRTQTYELHNGKDRVKSLSYTAWKELAAIWRDSARYIYDYTGDKLTKSSFQIWFGSSWTDHVVSELEYDNNNLSALNSTTYNATFNYDANNHMVAVEDEHWSQSSGWQKNEKKLYTYNGENVETFIVQKWNVQSGAWDNTEYYEYKYSGKNITETVQKIWNGSSWVTSKKSLFTYDNNNNQLSETKQVWNASASAFENAMIYKWEYNDYHLPVMLTTSTWNNTTGAWYHGDQDFQIRYYYQVYFPTAVNAIAKSEVGINCYPIPARDNINIDINLTRPGTCNIYLMDINGRIVRQWNENISGTVTKAYDVAGLTAGNYFIKVSGSEDNFTQQVTIF